MVRAPEAQIWNHDYLVFAWQPVIDALHSFPLIFLALLICWRFPSGKFAALALLLHSLGDFPSITRTPTAIFSLSATGASAVRSPIGIPRTTGCWAPPWRSRWRWARFFSSPAAPARVHAGRSAGPRCCISPSMPSSFITPAPARPSIPACGSVSGHDPVGKKCARLFPSCVFAAGVGFDFALELELDQRRGEARGRKA